MELRPELSKGIAALRDRKSKAIEATKQSANLQFLKSAIALFDDLEESELSTLEKRQLKILKWNLAKIAD